MLILFTISCFVFIFFFNFSFSALIICSNLPRHQLTLCVLDLLAVLLVLHLVFRESEICNNFFWIESDTPPPSLLKITKKNPIRQRGNNSVQLQKYSFYLHAFSEGNRLAFSCETMIPVFLVVARLNLLKSIYVLLIFWDILAPPPDIKKLPI